MESSGRADRTVRISAPIGSLQTPLLTIPVRLVGRKIDKQLGEIEFEPHRQRGLHGVALCRRAFAPRRERTPSRSVGDFRGAAFSPGRLFDAEDAARRRAPPFALLHDPPSGLLRQTNVRGVQAAAVDDDLVGLEPHRDPGQGELDALKQVVRKEEPILGAVEPNPKGAILRRERLIEAGFVDVRDPVLRIPLKPFVHQEARDFGSGRQRPAPTRVLLNEVLQVECDDGFLGGASEGSEYVGSTKPSQEFRTEVAFDRADQPLFPRNEGEMFATQDFGGT